MPAWLSRLRLLWHTVRYLRPEQVLFRLYYRLRPLRVRPCSYARCRDHALALQVVERAAPASVDGVVFRFLGEDGQVRTAGDWNAAGASKLWLYHLHYLDDLNAVGAGQRRAVLDGLVTRWINENPPVGGNGWEPYPLSLRIVNLVKWFARHPAPEAAWFASLATQARALEKRVEYHILGNHLFANGKALVFAGVYLEGADADRWLKKGLRILDREIDAQFLEDGAHFELSPMYHATVLWDLADLINLTQAASLSPLETRLARWRRVFEKGLVWMQGMKHPDGELAFFNDAAFGMAPPPASLVAYAGTLGLSAPASARNNTPVEAHHFAPSGYAVLFQTGDHKALLDLAPVGPDYQPGHAHADTLSFELSLFGRRVLVNSGTSRYGDGPERQSQRGTAAHNTVVVNGQDSSEVWSGFRVARRAKPEVEAFVQKNEQVRVRASHDGYLRLPGRNRHTREWHWEAGRLVVRDHVSGEFESAVAFFHLHPDVEAHLERGDLNLRLPGGKRVILRLAGAGRVCLRSGYWHPAFGVSQPNQCLEVSFSGSDLCTEILWSEAV